MTTDTTKPYAVNLWGSHPDEDNDDCISGDDFATIEEARAIVADWRQHFPPRCCAGVSHVEIDGPDVHKVVQVATDAEIRRRKLADEADIQQWRHECAMEAGMLGGVDAYNETMGW